MTSPGRLFLVALATARCVSELQAVILVVSFSGEDLFLSSLPEFWAKTESSSNRLPWSFVVCSLKDFVGNHPDELLLCPVRALRYYLHFTSSIVSHPRALFLLIDLLSPCPRMPWVSSIGTLFLGRCLTRVLALWSVVAPVVSMVWPRRQPSFAMPPWPLSSRLRRGVPPLSSAPFI